MQTVAAPLIDRATRNQRAMRRLAWSASCRLWGHHVDNALLRDTAGPARHCRCGADYLREDGSCTRVRHTLSCFLGHHTYERLTQRHGYNEYVCVRCGHPLLFRIPTDPYAGRQRFGKKVRYLCGLLGHRVHKVTTRHGYAEHACGCGHTFLKPEAPRHRITHPLSCVLFGHFVRVVARRAGHVEFVCRTCGHPFCFAQSRA